MPTTRQVITHPSQLNSLSAIPFFRNRGLGRLTLSGNIGGHPEHDRWERELNRYYHACGCATSAKGLLIGLLVSVVWGAYSYASGSWATGQIVMSTLLLLLLGAIVGKVVGLARANSRLQQVVREIQSNWRPVEPPILERRSCG